MSGNEVLTNASCDKKKDAHEVVDVSLLPFLPGCTGHLSLKSTAVMGW